MRLSTKIKTIVLTAVLLGIIAGASWLRLYRPDIGYKVGMSISRLYYRGEVDHRFTESFLVALSLAILSAYVGYLAHRDILRYIGRRNQNSPSSPSKARE